MPELAYAVVLTSCGRFDLLRKTLQSFRQFADVPPAQFILIEDSGDARVHDAVAGCGFDIDVIVNAPRLGQTRSIDRAYARVTHDWVFHCEDDWEFLRTGFIRGLPCHPATPCGCQHGRPAEPRGAQSAGAAHAAAGDSRCELFPARSVPASRVFQLLLPSRPAADGRPIRRAAPRNSTLRREALHQEAAKGTKKTRIAFLRVCVPSWSVFKGMNP